MNEITSSYQQSGGVFITPPSVLIQKMTKVKALLFDWDGVFNDGRKTQSSGSGFSEVDSMGINMLRFSLWLKQTLGQRVKVAIITGENNPTALMFARREGFDAVYYQMKDKSAAFHHFCTEASCKPAETAFFFDDILDLSVADQAGVRLLMQRKSGHAFNDYVAKKGLADYATGNEAGHYSVREVCELWMALNGSLQEVIEKRMIFEGEYADYFKQRNDVSTQFYTLKEGKVLKVENPTV